MQMFLKLLTVVVAIVSLVCGTTSGVSGLLRATEDIITPDNVRAGYRHLTLTNNLDVLLMSDPDLDKVLFLDICYTFHIGRRSFECLCRRAA